MKIVIQISAGAEWRAVKELLTPGMVNATPLGETFCADLSGWQVDLFHGGWGRTAAAASTQYIIDCLHPDLLINLGTCGGIAGRIERGEIILVTRTLLYDIHEQMGDPQEAIDHYTSELDLSWLDTWAGDPGNKTIRRGLLVSADRDLVPGDIPMLVEKYGAVAADWESAAITWVAHKNGIRCVILRGVSDLVSPAGGEAYNNLDLFHRNTRTLMEALLGKVPGLLVAVMDARGQGKV